MGRHMLAWPTMVRAPVAAPFTFGIPMNGIMRQCGARVMSPDDCSTWRLAISQDLGSSQHPGVGK